LAKSKSSLKQTPRKVPMCAKNQFDIQPPPKPPQKGSPLTHRRSQKDVMEVDTPSPDAGPTPPAMEVDGWEYYDQMEDIQEH
ncbi:hypothetical protein BT69DRAFT_1277810, partial [Atractiella rhizophila]